MVREVVASDQPTGATVATAKRPRSREEILLALAARLQQSLPAGPRVMATEEDEKVRDDFEAAMTDET